MRRDLDERYTSLRRSEKRHGQRRPTPDVVTPTSPRRWHGDERAAALHALRSIRDQLGGSPLCEHPVGADVLVIADRAVAGKPFAGSDLASLEASLAWARHQLAREQGHADPADSRTAHALHGLLGHLHVLAHGAQPLGTVWHFVTVPAVSGGQSY
ncbi:MAG: hypothetical protein Q4F65_13820 [Propionibacteriaceae bacterium]|nr:hypothetical protein [Propionibacteriaceae bacterium]